MIIEVWQQGNGIRLVLLIDFWHPDLSKEKRSKMEPLPVTEGEDRTTVFHIGGIVSDLTESVAKTSSTNVITTPPDTKL